MLDADKIWTIPEASERFEELVDLCQVQWPIHLVGHDGEAATLLPRHEYDRLLAMGCHAK